MTIELELDKVTSQEIAKRSLVGKVLSDKMLNRGSVKSMLAKAWGIQMG